MITAITNACIFDGENVIRATTVLIEGEQILSVGGEYRHMRSPLMRKEGLYCRV